MAKSRFLVLGAGRSGLAAAAWLVRCREQVLLSDDRLPLELIATRWHSYATKLGVVPSAAEPCRLEPGIHETVSHLVVSPGIAPSHPLVVAARDAGLRVCSELELAFAHRPRRVIAVTGTNGKSTLVTLIAHLLMGSEEAAVCVGNIGRPPCELLTCGDSSPTWVLEVSSYQLEYFPTLHADFAVFGHFASDHLERHGSVEAYFRAKWQLMTHARWAAVTRQVRQQAAALGLKPLPGSCDLDHHGRWPRLLPSGSVWQRGVQRHNACWAAQVVEATGVADNLEQTFGARLMTYPFLPHRMTTIGRLPSGTVVINNSKATNVASVLSDLESLSRPALLWLGGLAKNGDDFAQLLAWRHRLVGVVLFGAAAAQIQTQLGGAIPVLGRYPTLDAALQQLSQTLEPFSGIDAVLMPGCASFDEFSSYEERGQVFTAACKALAHLT